MVDSPLSSLIHAQVVGSVIFCSIGALLYFNYLLFKDYFPALLWAFLLSQALGSWRNGLLNSLKHLRSHQGSLFKIICDWLIANILSTLPYFNSYYVRKKHIKENTVQRLLENKRKKKEKNIPVTSLNERSLSNSNSSSNNPTSASTGEENHESKDVTTTTTATTATTTSNTATRDDKNTISSFTSPSESLSKSVSSLEILKCVSKKGSGKSNRRESDASAGEEEEAEDHSSKLSGSKNRSTRSRSHSKSLSFVPVTPSTKAWVQKYIKIHKRKHRAKGNRSTLKLIVDNSMAVFCILLILLCLVKILGVWMLGLFLIGMIVTFIIFVYVFDKKVLYIWNVLGISDDTFISLFLGLGMIIMVSFIVCYLGIEAIIEGSGAIVSTSSWVQEYIKDETTQDMFQQRLQNMYGFANDGYTQLETTYNETAWWPTLEASKFKYEEGTNVTIILDEAMDSFGVVYDSEPWWPIAKDIGWVLLQVFSNTNTKETMSWGEALNTFRTALDHFFGIGSVGEIITIAYSYLARMTDTVVWFTKLLSILGYIWNIVLLLGSWGGWVFLFLYFLLVMLNPKRDTLLHLVRLILPGFDDDYHTAFATKLRLSLEGVFFLPIQLSCIHSTITLIIGMILGVDFVFFATIITFLMSMLQILGSMTWLVCLPWAIALIIHSTYIKAAILISVHFIAFKKCDEALFDSFAARGRIQSPLFTALSLGLGFYTFGLQGVLFGPLLVCLLNILLIGDEDDDNDLNKNSKEMNEEVNEFEFDLSD